MNVVKNNKKLAILLIVIFTSQLISYLYSMCSNFLFETGGMAHVIGTQILSLPAVVTIGMIAIKKDLYITKIAQIFAWVLFALQVISILDNLIFSMWEGYMSFIKTHSSFIIIYGIIRSVTFAIITALFYIFLQSWTPITVTGAISAVPGTISLILLTLPSFKYGIIFPAIGVMGLLRIVLYVVNIILSIVWLKKMNDVARPTSMD